MTTSPELPPPTPAACDGDRRHEPISATVVWFAPQVDPYRLPPPQRLAVADESMATIQVHEGGAARTTERLPSTFDQREVWRVPDDAAFEALCAAHAAAQHTLDALALALRRLGRYDARLAAAGGITAAPNPLTPTVIAALDPECPPRGSGALAAVPPSVRCPVRAHTPKMLYVQFWGTRWSRGAQRQFVVGPSDDAWQALQVAQQAVATACGTFRAMLHALGCSSDARTDGRSTPGLRTGAGAGDPLPERTRPPASSSTSTPGGQGDSDAESTPST